MLAVDPSRRKTGGALLGDRIRMNAINTPKVFMRSLATRDTGSEVSAALGDAIAACKVAGFDLVVVETAGIGQGDAAVVPHVDVSLYVMTPEYGAASQLEKIDMLDFADFVAINKFDRKGAEDALRDVRKQYQRNRQLFAKPTDEMPVFGTQASRFNDDGVTALYQAIAPKLAAHGFKPPPGQACRRSRRRRSTSKQAIVPPARARYLAEIADAVRGYKRHASEQSRIARERQQLRCDEGRCSAASSRRMPGSSPTVAEGLDSGIRRNDEELDALITARDAAPRRPLEEAPRDVAGDAARPTRATSTW